MAYTLKDNYDALCEKLASRNVDIEWVKNKLKEQRIELPSWAVGNSGTRYGTFSDKGAAVTVWDLSLIHIFTPSSRTLGQADIFLQ